MLKQEIAPLHVQQAGNASETPAAAPENDEQPDFHPRNLSVIPLDLDAILKAEPTPTEDDAQPDFHPRNLSVVPLDLDAILADDEV